MRGHPARLDQQHVHAGDGPQDALGGEVQRAGAAMLDADRLGDHGCVGGQDAGMIGDQQRRAVTRHVVDALDLDAKPVVVEEVKHRPVKGGVDCLRSPPVGHAPVGLKAGQVVAEVGPSRDEGRAAGCGDG
jgi:hypothetical protein